MNRVSVLTLILSFSAASCRASISPISSRMELNALLVSGKQVSSGQGRSTSMHPDIAGMQNKIDRSNGRYTCVAEWVDKYAFLKSGQFGLACEAPIWDARGANAGEV